MKLKDKIKNALIGFIGIHSLISDYETLKQELRNEQYLSHFILEEYKHDDKLLARIFKNYKYTEYDKLPYGIKTFLITELKIKRHYGNDFWGFPDTLYIEGDYIGDADYALGRIEERINKLKECKKKGK